MKFSAAIVIATALLVATSACAEEQPVVEGKLYKTLHGVVDAVALAQRHFSRGDDASGCERLRYAYYHMGTVIELAEKDRALIVASTELSDSERQAKLADLDAHMPTFVSQRKDIQRQMIQKCAAPG